MKVDMSMKGDMSEKDTTEKIRASTGVRALARPPSAFGYPIALGFPRWDVLVGGTAGFAHRRAGPGDRPDGASRRMPPVRPRSGTCARRSSQPSSLTSEPIVTARR